MNISRRFCVLLQAFLFLDVLATSKVSLTTEEFMSKFALRTRGGLAREVRIVGGEEVIAGRYGYQASLTLQNEDVVYPFCGGTLIAPQWVLSAAHCHGLATHVEIGHHNMTDRNPELFELVEVEKEIKHPRYDENSFDLDAMLVKLARPVTNYEPIQLDNGSVFGDKIDTWPKEGTSFTLLGWGTTTYGGEVSDVLRQVQVDLFPYRKCNIRFLGGLTKNMICAWKSGRDACQGDSGGPMIMRGSVGVTDVQVGIVSWGVGCASERFPGVYTRISALWPFLNRHVNFNPTTDEEEIRSIENEIGNITSTGGVHIIETTTPSSSSSNNSMPSNTTEIVMGNETIPTSNDAILMSNSSYDTNTTDENHNNMSSSTLVNEISSIHAETQVSHTSSRDYHSADEFDGTFTRTFHNRLRGNHLR